MRKREKKKEGEETLSMASDAKKKQDKTCLPLPTSSSLGESRRKMRRRAGARCFFFWDGMLVVVNCYENQQQQEEGLVQHLLCMTWHGWIEKKTRFPFGVILICPSCPSPCSIFLSVCVCLCLCLCLFSLN